MMKVFDSKRYDLRAHLGILVFHWILRRRIKQHVLCEMCKPVQTRWVQKAPNVHLHEYVENVSGCY